MEWILIGIMIVIGILLRMKQEEVKINWIIKIINKRKDDEE